MKGIISKTCKAYAGAALFSGSWCRSVSLSAVSVLMALTAAVRNAELVGAELYALVLHAAKRCLLQALHQDFSGTLLLRHQVGVPAGHACFSTC